MSKFEDNPFGEPMVDNPFAVRRFRHHLCIIYSFHMPIVICQKTTAKCLISNHILYFCVLSCIGSSVGTTSAPSKCNWHFRRL